jgi:hypothetical protein
MHGRLRGGWDDNTKNAFNNESLISSTVSRYIKFADSFKHRKIAKSADWAEG